jgi:hypothetical protein
MKLHKVYGVWQVDSMIIYISGRAKLFSSNTSLFRGEFQTTTN